ncbi:hypothetical protein, partial [Actinacidiphila acidipaludis]
SDRLVFDYLSRVGDLAQSALPSSQRMQLVAQLRNDIDRQRGGTGGDSPAAVRRILGRIGTPDEVVEAAAGSPGDGHGRGTGSGAGARQRSGTGGGPGARSGGDSGGGAGTGAGGASGTRSGAGRRGARTGDADGPYAERGPQVPRARAEKDTDAPGRDGDEPDWWRKSPRTGTLRAGDELAGLPGMTGGVFIPVDDEELADDDPPGRPARSARPVAAADAAADAEVYEEAEDALPAARAPRRLLPGLRRVRSGWGSPSLLLAALLLVAGAALGSLIPLGLGWLLAYLSRALSRPQAKFAVLGIPGAAAAGLIVWVWGRDVGKWGAPIAQGQVGRAFQDSYPVAIRLAAVGTALYLLWRSRRSG